MSLTVSLPASQNISTCSIDAWKYVSDVCVSCENVCQKRSSNSTVAGSTFKICAQQYVCGNERKGCSCVRDWGVDGCLEPLTFFCFCFIAVCEAMELDLVDSQYVCGNERKGCSCVRDWGVDGCLEPLTFFCFCFIAVCQVMELDLVGFSVAQSRLTTSAESEQLFQK